MPLGPSAPEPPKTDLSARPAQRAPRSRLEDSEDHARRPPAGRPRVPQAGGHRPSPPPAGPAGSRATARRGSGSPRDSRETAPRIGPRLLQHLPAAAAPELEPEGAWRGPGGAGRSREPESEPQGRGAGRWPLPRRPLEGRRVGGAPPPLIRGRAAPANKHEEGAGGGSRRTNGRQPRYLDLAEVAARAEGGWGRGTPEGLRVLSPLPPTHTHSLTWRPAGRPTARGLCKVVSSS